MEQIILALSRYDRLIKEGKPVAWIIDEFSLDYMLNIDGNEEKHRRIGARSAIKYIYNIIKTYEKMENINQDDTI